MVYAIKTNGITKQYGSFTAVDKVSLTVKKGEIYGFIGLNGAGKTTTLKMILGMVTPTKGACYINGTKVTRSNNFIWNNVGHIVEAPNYYPELTLQENLIQLCKLRLIDNLNVVSEIINKLNLSRYKNVKANNLSLGNKQRLGLAKALLHNPNILVLDEPINGLDPQGIIEIRNLLHSLAHEHGVTILFSSHFLSEVAQIATKIGIIHHGKLIKEITTEQLSNLLAPKLKLSTVNNERALAILQTANYDVYATEQDELIIQNKEAVTNPEIITKLLVNNDIPPTMIKKCTEDLETYFLKNTLEKGLDQL